VMDSGHSPNGAEVVVDTSQVVVGTSRSDSLRRWRKRGRPNSVP